MRPESEIPRVTNGWQRMVESGALIDRFKQSEPVTRSTLTPATQIPRPLPAALEKSPSTSTETPSKLPRVTNGWRRMVESGQLIDRFKQPEAIPPRAQTGTVPARFDLRGDQEGPVYIGRSAGSRLPELLDRTRSQPPAAGLTGPESLRRMQVGADVYQAARPSSSGAADAYDPWSLALPLQLPSYDTVSVPGFTSTQNPRVETFVILGPYRPVPHHAPPARGQQK
ncbi:MAG: hypothetical protein AMXMBFR7_43320 [Planctomycetota bacterium]